LAGRNPWSTYTARSPPFSQKARPRIKAHAASIAVESAPPDTAASSLASSGTRASAQVIVFNNDIGIDYRIILKDKSIKDKSGTRQFL
jgi:hypothetical protein